MPSSAKTREKGKKIAALLDQLYPHPKVPLSHGSHYTLLIAVLLSAQCTDARVNSITPRLFALADSPEKMALLEVEKIEEIIRPCGLAPTKARAIKKLSDQLIERHGGAVPRSYRELEALSGVGHKTASVIMAQAFDIPAFPVDTHIHRCAKRWGLSSGTTVKKTEEELKAIFPKASWQKLHLQIIYFARQHCQARQHCPQECPICSWACEES